MKRKAVFLFFALIAGVAAAGAQTRSVTNADLEGYRQKRLDADRKYRESYEKTGMMSPEEIDRDRQKSYAELQELSSKLRAERIEQERIDLQQRSGSGYAETLYRQQNSIFATGYYAPYGEYFSTFYGITGRGVRRMPYRQPGYFAGGQFWPPGARTAAQPMIARPVNVRR